MCPAAPPPESSKMPVNDAAVHSATARFVGALLAEAGAVLAGDDVGAAADVDAAVALEVSLALASGVVAVPVEFPGPQAARDAPSPSTATRANSFVEEFRLPRSRGDVVMPLPFRARN